MAKTTLTENILYVVVLVIGLSITIGPILWNHFRSNSILEDGSPAQATILKLTDTGRRHNSDSVMMVDLQFKRTDGIEQRAEVTMPLSALQISKLSIGATVEIRFDEGDPSRVALVME